MRRAVLAVVSLLFLAIVAVPAQADLTLVPVFSCYDGSILVIADGTETETKKEILCSLAKKLAGLGVSKGRISLRRTVERVVGEEVTSYEVMGGLTFKEGSEYAFDGVRVIIFGTRGDERTLKSAAASIIRRVKNSKRIK